MAKKLITLKVDEADHEDWKRRAEKEEMWLSAWIRERCNEDLERLSTRNMGTKAGIERTMPVYDENSLRQRAGKGTCPHRKRKGELCYKCDPKFGNPVIE